MVLVVVFFFFLMIRRPPRSTLDRSSAASDVYKRQVLAGDRSPGDRRGDRRGLVDRWPGVFGGHRRWQGLSLIHISEPTRPY